jgi:hypothetical protein
MYIDPDWGPFWMRSGGGIFIDSSGATLEYNNIKDNTIESNIHATGGGIRAWAVPAGKAVVIRKNHITNNTVYVPENSGGGGIDIYNLVVDDGSYIIKSNIIENNLVQISKTWKAWGGGIACHVDLPFNGKMEIGENMIRQNELKCYNTFGAGIYVTYWQHDDNSDYKSNPKIFNNIIVNNISPKYGSAISIWNPFRHNYELAELSPKPFVCNNTIIDNMGYSSIHIFQSTPLFMNNILKNKNSNSRDFRFEHMFDARIGYNGIELYNNFIADTVALFKHCKDYKSVNNIFHVDTLFKDSLYILADSSNCIGKGIAEILSNGIKYTCPSSDFYGNPRANSIDIGAVESQVVSINNSEINLPNKFKLNQNYPNPFNPRTMIDWQIVKSDEVELTIYNVLGKKIAVLISKHMNPGTYTYYFDGSDLASGVYYYKLQSGNDVAVRKMILLR